MHSNSVCPTYLVWHTLLLCCVGLDVNNVSDVERSEVGGELNGTMLPELAGKQVASSCPETK